MSDEKSDLVLDLVLVIICFFVGGFLGYVGGKTIGDKMVRQEAVRNYAAVYVANDDGEPEFKWRTQL